VQNILDDLLISADVGANKAGQFVSDSLQGMDDGELYLQYTQSEDLVFDDGRVKSSSFDVAQGFGLRGVLGETSAYAHSTVLDKAALNKAAETVQSVKTGQGGSLALAPTKTEHSLYSGDNPTQQQSFAEKVGLLQKVDAYARSKSNLVQQVSVSLSGEWDAIRIVRGDGQVIDDYRPLVQMYVSVVVSDGTRQETGSHGVGSRSSYDDFLKEENWKSYVDEAMRSASVKLEARTGPAGELPVVLGSGWCGVLLHEAVGHGLEGDFNRKKTSAFAGLMGEQVAAKGVTVVDDGTIPGRRGSLNVDDEGTPTNRNVLIEDGKLVGYMQDRQNARLMGVDPTGNGRRQSYAHLPMPRMTNTYMLGGDHSQDEIISSVKDGVYAVDFGLSQVDITSGRFVISATEAYRIENGKISHPIKKCTFIGNGPDVMRKITMVGNDMALDPGIGSCGKNGQSVPVGVGQPSVLIDGMTVGGA